MDRDGLAFATNELQVEFNFFVRESLLWEGRFRCGFGIDLVGQTGVYFSCAAVGCAAIWDLGFGMGAEICQTSACLRSCCCCCCCCTIEIDGLRCNDENVFLP